MAEMGWIEGGASLRDGRFVRFRAVRADDEPAILRLLVALSPESRRLRFFSSATDLGRAAHEAVEGRRPGTLGLVALAEADDEVVAHALAVGIDATRAEVAFEVADAYHGQGLGTLLLIRLAALAEAHGIEHFVAEVLPENHDMLAVFRDAFPEHVAFEPGLVTVEVPTRAWRSARERFEPARAEAGRAAT